MIDLHTHTNASDGSYTPEDLVDRALALGLEGLAISDHDTFEGYERALPSARSNSLDLVCAIELSARLDGKRARTVHVLGYFLHQPPSLEFRSWLSRVLAARMDRNVRLIAKLQSMGVEIELEEVQRIGRTLTGRPHFARILVEKRYAANSEEAFRKYLAEPAPAYVERQAAPAALVIQNLVAAGGLPVLAHPVRMAVSDATVEEALIAELCDAGLRGIEVYHSDHDAADVGRYQNIAKRYGLAVSGGSDFHGEAKPQIALGTGMNGNLNIPVLVLEELRRA